ncbi:MAG: hypothetical protein J0G37_00800 [Afipia sp.]|jgi:hypothetical protein|nr:hypothetical protein [Afipia sp.]
MKADERRTLRRGDYTFHPHQNLDKIDSSHLIYREIWMKAFSLSFALIAAALTHSTAAEASPEGLAVVQALPCQSMTYGTLANRLAARSNEPLGIPLSKWDAEVAEAILNRIRACSAEISPRYANDALRLLPNYLAPLVQQGNAARAASKYSEEESSYKCDPSKYAVRDDASRSQMESWLGVPVTRSAPAQQSADRPARTPEEYTAREHRKRMEAKEKACADAAQQAADAEGRRAEQQRRSDQKRAAEEKVSQRLEQAQAEVRQFVAENPQLKDIGFGTDTAVNQIMIGLYSTDIVLRVCRERFGEYQDEVRQLQEKIRLTELSLQQIHDRPSTTFLQLRQVLGVDSGRGQLIDAARASPTLRSDCRTLAGQYGLSPPLAR